MLQNNKSSYIFNFIAALLLAFILLFLQKGNYWRPYTYTGQDSIGSAYAHGCALANEIGLKKNPFMIHDIDFVHHRIHEYTHWPNGHFFLFYLVIKVFGNSEVVGRSFALAMNLMGLILLALAFRDKSGLIFYAVPMFLLTPIARDAIPYVFIEPSFHFWIGFSAFSVSFAESLDSRRLSRILFRISCVLAPFFAHLMLPFLILGALTRGIFHRNKREFAIDVLILISAFIGVFLALSWTEEGLYQGAKDLFLQFLHRSNLKIRFAEETPVTIVQLVDTYVYKLKHNLLGFWYLLPLAWIFCTTGRKSIAFLLPAAVLNITIMINYVYPHVFAQYNFIMIAFVTTFFLVSHLLERIADFSADFFQQGSNSSSYANRVIIKAAIFLTVFIFASYEVRVKTMSYAVDPLFTQFHNTFNSLKSDMDNSKCNCFDRITYQQGELVKYGGRTIGLYGQFFLGEKVLTSIITKEPVLCGGINIEDGTLYCTEDGIDAIPFENFIP